MVNFVFLLLFGFKDIFYLKLKANSQFWMFSLFNVARYLTDSLRGPVLQTLRRARSANLMGWGGVFNVARYLTDSLRGPVLQTLRRVHEVREFDGTGRTGWTVPKSVL